MESIVHGDEALAGEQTVAAKTETELWLDGAGWTRNM